MIISDGPARGRSQDTLLQILDQDPQDSLNCWRILEALSVNFWDYVRLINIETTVFF